MRDLINLISLFENDAFSARELEAFKSVIASKIKQLPDDDTTAKTLREIEDLLKHVHAGGKMGIINGELQKVDDPTVLAAQKELAKFIYSLEMDPHDRDEMFQLWREDKLVDRKKLLSKGKFTFNEIIRKYDSNAGIRNFVNEIMRIQALGQGKGEFGLSVLSKNINKPSGKGDLIIDGRKIEVKTFDKAAARFTDQEVIPAAGYAKQAEEVNAFVRQHDRGLVPKSGLNLVSAIEFGQRLSGADSAKYYKMINALVKLIFGGPNANAKDVSALTDAIRQGDTNGAKQAYARASFNYYMSMKDDEGVLSLDISKEPIETIFYRDADELAALKQRFEAETVYLTSPTFREVYPKISIVPTSFGANAKAKAEKAAQQAATKAAKASPVDVPTVSAKQQETQDKVYAFVTNLANAKGVFDQDLIDSLAMQAMDLLVQQVPAAQIKTQINNAITQSAKPTQPVAQEPIAPAVPIQPIGTTAPIRPRR